MIAADAAVIREIERLAEGAWKLEGHIIQRDGRTYTTKDLKVLQAPLAAALAVGTLTGLSAYINKKLPLDAGVASTLVHVVSHDEVRVFTDLDLLHRRRETYIVAKAAPVLGVAFTFGQFMEAEPFVIALQALFVDSDDRAEVLRLVGNIREEKVRNVGDDGVTQEVTAKAGIALSEMAVVPNPVTLRPFRTFREVEQPSSPFILRLQQGREGGLPRCALFEADGGEWKLKAIDNIAIYLGVHLTADITIIA